VRPIQATISTAALAHNYAVARRAATGAKVLAVVKANGYGHGVTRVAKALRDADGFGTVELDSALAIRDQGFAGPVVLLEGFFEPAELDAIGGASLATVVHHEDQLRMLEEWRGARPLDVFFKINTGMNRLGFASSQVRPMLERLRSSGATRSITLMSHFATADGPPGIEEAMARFDEATRGIDLPRSLANSAAIFAHPRSHADVARLGICLYGATPFADRTAESLGLRPAMTLRSRIIAIQDLVPGATVGYGASFRAEKAMRVGVVACGYADGYPRHAPSGTPLRVADVLARTAGRVSMDMITVDIAGIPGARVGTPVTLWGDGLPIDEVANAAGTVGYELMCAVMPRVPMVEAD
jgi:alanine racemase